MQSKLVSSSTALCRLLLSSNKSRCARFASASTGRTADPSVHAARIDDDEAAEAEKSKMAEENRDHRTSTATSEPLVSPKLPHSPSTRLESNAVNQPVEPTIQQKRRKSSANVDTEVSCAGFDGSPWPDEDKNSRKEMEEQRADQEEGDKEYFKHNKASPLSMIEVADTRKPVTKATDGTADSKFASYEEGRPVWRPEQVETAEEALLRTARLWRERAMRGDPDFPPSRVLREMKLNG